MYIASYSVHTDDGSTFQDGVANLTFTGQDLAGNDFEEILPATGATFAIDTLPPGKPVLILPSNTTLFSEMNVAVTGEPFSTATLRVSRQFIDATVNPDDGLDNDGDGRSDEEPGGRNGLDDDRDGFVDEDYSDNLCGLDEFLNQGACTIPTLDKRPSFSRQLNDIGSATITVTLGLGKNIVTGRLKDLAGNTGLASDPVTITNNAPQQLQLDHTFAQAGWQAVSIPMVPNFLSPIQGFQLNTDFLSVAPPLYRSGKQVAVMSPGVGYWVNVPAANTEVTMYGQTSKTKVLSLTKGWNLIGPPYNQVIPWNANIGVSQDINLQNQFSLTSTEAAALLHPNAYRYNPTTKTYDTLTPGSGNLSPFQGYFVLAFKDCQLILPDPP